jgi:serine/threonine protein kinase
MPKVTLVETLDRRYFGKMNKIAIGFMKCCLKMDPSERITAAEAVLHPYFDEVREVSVPQRPHTSKIIGHTEFGSGRRTAANPGPRINNLITPITSQFSKPGSRRQTEVTQRSTNQLINGSNLGHIESSPTPPIFHF